MIDSLVRVSRRDGEAVIRKEEVQWQYNPFTTIKQPLLCIHSYHHKHATITIHASFNHSYA